jgi:hypothetical protein
MIVQRSTCSSSSTRTSFQKTGAGIPTVHTRHLFAVRLEITTRVKRLEKFQRSTKIGHHLQICSQEVGMRTRAESCQSPHQNPELTEDKF